MNLKGIKLYLKLNRIKMKNIFLFALIFFVGKLNAQMMVSNGEEAVQNSYAVKSIFIDANIKNQIAEVSVTQTIQNKSDRDMEVELYFPLPTNGVIQNLVMMVDGQEITAQLLEAKEARAIYNGIVQKKKDPALMEFAGYGLFKTSVFPMAIGSERNISIRYTQVCEKHQDLIRFIYPLSTQKFSKNVLESVDVNMIIQTKEDIKTIYSPNAGVTIKRDNDRTASVKMSLKNVIPTSNFKLNYNTSKGKIGASLMSHINDENGCFMLLASPQIEQENQQKIAKNIVFVIDKSGSMAGKKIVQSREALKFVLNNLEDYDYFNIVSYNDRVNQFKNDLVKANSANIKEALTFVDGIHQGGGTNIDGALTQAFQQYKSDEMPNYMMFLTDGLPTAGNTDETHIVTNSNANNKFKTRLFCFGVGNNVNARLLDKLSTQNGGKAVYVSPNEDIEASVSDLYSSISSPVLTDVEITIPGSDIYDTYPSKLPDMFKGGQLLLTGKYKTPGSYTAVIKGKVNGEEKEFKFPVELLDKDKSGEYDFVEKSWASKRIAYLLEQIDQNGESKELTDELVELSKKHGILTPYTSFLAREDVQFADMQSNYSRASGNLKTLNSLSGSSANSLRQYKGKLAEIEAVEDAAPSEEMFYDVEEDADLASYNINSVDTTIAPKVEKKITNVGNNTFYKKEKYWIAGDVDATKLSSAINVTKFSKEYFELSNNLSAEDQKYLGLDGSVYVNLNGKLYYIEEVKKP